MIGYTYYREQKNSHADFNCPANGKAIRCNVIDTQIEDIVKCLVLEPSWGERIISKLSTLSEHERLLKQRKQTNERLRRLAKAYMDGVVDDGEYDVQRKLLQDILDSLVIPETDAALNAGNSLRVSV